MKKYILDLRELDKYTAGSKAREDAEQILKSEGFIIKTINVKSINKSLNSLLLELPSIKKQIKIIMNEIDRNSLLVIQYPWIYLSYGFAKEIRKLANKRNINCVALIHDLNLFRTGSIFTKAYYKFFVREIDFLNNFDYIIVHNNVMRSLLEEKGIDSTKIIVLELFDYLADFKNERLFNINDKNKINIAGNLSKEKAGYIYRINELENQDFQIELYGPKFAGKVGKNIKYNGIVPPEKLTDVINYGYGLIWDGKSINTCEGNFGKYLTINNPHKFSLYMACGIPVIIWEKAALADFVKVNQVGITISSLDEINSKLKQITTDEYKKLLNNVSLVQEKVLNGQYLKSAVNEIIKRMVKND